MITNLEDQLLRDEGEILHAYKDSLGFLTIGVGHLIDKSKAGSIPPEISRALLKIDIDSAKAGLAATFPWALTLDQVRQEALINLIFNMGSDGLAKFVHFLAAVKSGDWLTAKAQLLASAADHEEPERIGRLAEQILTGVRQ